MCSAAGCSSGWRARFLCEFTGLCIETPELLGERPEKRYGLVRDSVCILVWVGGVEVVVPYTAEGIAAVHLSFKGSGSSLSGR